MSIQFTAHHARNLAASILGLTLLAFSGAPALAQPLLSLPDALSRAAASDPTSSANAARLDAAGANVRQASFGPRPRLGIDVEDFSGSAPYTGVNRAQSTAYYEQIWERGGKREARVGVAQADVETTRQKASIRLLDIIAKVQIAWVDAAAAEAAITVAEERLRIAERLEQEVQRRVSRALDPVFAGERAKAASAQARIARDQAVESARIARTTLASWWAGSADFRVDVQDYLRTDGKRVAVESNPELALLAAEREVANASIRLAESGSSADPTFRVGIRHFAADSGLAVIVGGSVPIGVESANISNIERAQAQRRAAEADLAVSRLEVRREADQLAADRVRITSEIARIDSEVLPTAERAASLVVQGYTRGGTAFTYLEMADAQRAVIEARMRRIELLRQFHQEGARLDRLSGRYSALTVSSEKKQ